MRRKSYGNRYYRPKHMEEKEGKDIWDKARIFGSISTAFILAFGAIMGSIYIPDKINQHSLRSRKIIQLSELVPQLYDSSKALRPSIIAMASYGSPAVSFLLLALDDAIETKRDDMIETIVSTTKYMNEDSKKEIRSRLKMEIEQLDQRNLSSHNLQYIGHIVAILEWPRLDNESMQILEEYFSIVSEFTDTQYKLKDLNGIILRALSENGFTISQLKLEGVSFAKQDLKNIDFSNTNLKKANFMSAKLYDCTFKGAILDSCVLKKAKLFRSKEDTLYILHTFEKFAESHWKEAILDTAVYDILIELEHKPHNTEKLLELATIAKEDIF